MQETNKTTALRELNLGDEFICRKKAYRIESIVYRNIVRKYPVATGTEFGDLIILTDALILAYTCGIKGIRASVHTVVKDGRFEANKNNYIKGQAVQRFLATASCIDPDGIIWERDGSAAADNVIDARYAPELATKRAIVRLIKMVLNLDVLTEDEMSGINLSDKKTSTPTVTSPPLKNAESGGISSIIIDPIASVEQVNAITKILKTKVKISQVLKKFKISKLEELSKAQAISVIRDS